MALQMKNDDDLLPHLWALQVNQEIPHRAMKIGWDAHTPQDKIDGILKSQRRAIQGVSDGDNYVYEKETLEISELETLEESIFEEFDPPKLTIKKLPFIKELHKKSSFLLPTCHDTEIDLSPLMSNLLPTSHVIEEDAHWDTNIILSEVLFKINKETQIPITLTCLVAHFFDW